MKINIKCIIDMWKRLINDRCYILKNAGFLTGSIYAVLGFIRTFAAFENLYIDKKAWMKILISVLVLMGVFAVTVVLVSIWVLINKKVKVVEGKNRRSVYVVYGDLFDQDLLPGYSGRRNICFSVNRCFDTIVNEKLISTQTIHGKAMKALYDEGIFTQASLNQLIQDSISPHAHFVTLRQNQKPDGNLKRYETGTAVDIEVSKDLHYFMIGVGPFNRVLSVQTPKTDYCRAVQSMIEFCDSHARGYPVLLPIIGGGLSRIGVDERTLLEYIIMAFKLNVEHINTDYYIVVDKGAKSKVSIYNL